MSNHFLEKYSLPTSTDNETNEDLVGVPGSLSRSIMHQGKLNADKSYIPKDTQFLYGVIHHIHHFLDAYRESRNNHSRNLNPSNDLMNQTIRSLTILRIK